jgi:hypothetical protein
LTSPGNSAWPGKSMRAALGWRAFNAAGSPTSSMRPLRNSSAPGLSHAHCGVSNLAALRIKSSDRSVAGDEADEPAGALSATHGLG